MNQPVAIVATINAREGQRATVLAALKEAVIAVQHEPGCEQYVLHQDPARPDSFVMIERWTSQRDLDAHEKAPAFIALIKKIEGLADLHVLALTPV